MTQQHTFTVYVGGLDFNVDSAEYDEKQSADANPISTLTVRVQPGSDIDRKLAYMYCTHVLSANGNSHLAVAAFGRTTDTAWWVRGVSGEYTLRLVDFLPIASPIRSGVAPAPTTYAAADLKLSFNGREFSPNLVNYVAPAVATARCQCGSGNHMRGPGHSAWCPLLDTGAQ